MISGYKVHTEMSAVYDMESSMWVGSGLIDIFKKEVGEEPITEHFATKEILAENSDDLFTKIADAIDELLWASTALDEDDLTDEA